MKLRLFPQGIVEKGGPGSGFQGHAGIHGHQGGSAPAGGFVDDQPKTRYSEKELKKYLVKDTSELSKTQYGYGGFISPDGNMYDSKPTHAAFVREVLKMGTTKALSEEDQKFFEEMGKLRHESEVIAILNGWDRVDVSKNETNFQTKFTDTTTLRRIQKYYTDGKIKASLDGQIVWEGMLHRDVNGDKVVSNIGYFRGTHSSGGATMMSWREFLTYDKVKFNADGEAVFKEKKLKVIMHKGGGGSGDFGHAGRPGEVGGSAGKGKAGKNISKMTADERQQYLDGLAEKLGIKTNVKYIDEIGEDFGQYRPSKLVSRRKLVVYSNAFEKKDEDYISYILLHEDTHRKMEDVNIAAITAIRENKLGSVTPKELEEKWGDSDDIGKKSAVFLYSKVWGMREEIMDTDSSLTDYMKSRHDSADEFIREAHRVLGGVDRKEFLRNNPALQSAYYTDDETNFVGRTWVTRNFKTFFYEYMDEAFCEIAANRAIGKKIPDTLNKLYDEAMQIANQITYGKGARVVQKSAAFGGNNMKVRLHVVEKGGAGSGFHGHQGRPGEVGGSTPEGGFVPDVPRPKVKLVRSRFSKKYSNMTNLRRPPKQGAFRSDLADIPGDGTVILKYKEYKKFRQPKEGSDGLQSDYRSDVESYRAAEQMGFEKLVPRTERVLNPDTGEKCAALEFITGDIATVAKSKKLTDTAVDQFSQLAVLDTITGNRDRHGGNLLVDQKTGKIHAIDNSLGFHDNLKRHLPGIQAAAKWYTKLTKRTDFHVLPQHIAAGDALVSNTSWRRRIVQKFSQAALDRIDVRWAEFKSQTAGK